MEGTALAPPESLEERWRARWEAALAAWSRFTKLSPPTWCRSGRQEQKEGLTGSFAMIRLQDHAVVIGLRQIEALGLQSFAVPILAHEIGHHVYAPGDLADHARLLARVRVGLPSLERLAGYVANLYTDLLINDRLQRAAGLDMAGVYRALRREPIDGLWALYVRIYEMLWSLPSGSLGAVAVSERTRTDAALGARLIRAYARHWLDGGGRFAALCLPYLMEMREADLQALAPWFDTRDAGAGGEAPDGLTELDEDEESGAIHPAEDPELTGLDGPAEEEDGPAVGGGRATRGGRKHRYRTPSSYVELMRSVGVNLSEDELLRRYYRERARPHLIRFPAREAPRATDPLPEGVETWEPGSPLADVDWVETVARSPIVVPGVTTVQRVFGTGEGASPERVPLDLYVGVDCSGSMANPKHVVSYPVLGAVILALSALRAGARVRAVLSGEPGEHSATDGWERREKEILRVLVGYLGTGYAFGVLRLKEDFLDAPPLRRPAHAVVVTDADVFHMLGEVKDGWEIAEQTLQRAGGGGTFVLHMPDERHWGRQVARLRGMGWDVRFVARWEDVVEFARAFSRRTWA